MSVSLQSFAFSIPNVSLVSSNSSKDMRNTPNAVGGPHSNFSVDEINVMYSLLQLLIIVSFVSWFLLQLVCPTTANLTGCAIFVKNDLRNYKGRRELVQYGSCDWAHTGEFSCFPGWLFAILVIGCILVEAFPRLVIP
jgi:hypothetical protein